GRKRGGDAGAGRHQPPGTARPLPGPPSPADDRARPGGRGRGPGGNSQRSGARGAAPRSAGDLNPMLTLDGCRARQERFLKRLEAAGIPAALISDPRDIYYLTGLLPENKVYAYPNLLFLGPGLRSWLATGLAEGEAAVDEKLPYEIN